MHKYLIHRLLPFLLLSLFAVLPLLTQAQEALPVTRIVEYDIGVRCPLGLTLDATQTQAWILMDACYDGNYGLQGYQLADGVPITTDVDQYVDALAPLRDQWIYSDTRPFAFTPDGAVDIIYNDPETYSALSLRFSLDGNQLPTSDNVLLTNDTIAELIPGYAGYPETITYNHDHTLAAIPDTAVTYIVDLQTGNLLFQIASQLTTDFTVAFFSTDGQFVYLSTLINAEDMTDYSSTLTAYSLSDGNLVTNYHVPTYFNIISPDNRYAIGTYSEDALMVTNLETGISSEPITYSEAPRTPDICHNSGLPAPTGVDFKTSGLLPVRDIVWLPDSTGFVTVNSNQGYGSGGGRTCIFDYSRMRIYTVG